MPIYGLVPRNPAYPVMLITEASDFEVLGVVTKTLAKLANHDRAKVLTRFLRTNRFNPSEQQYTPSLTTELHLPTDDTRDLVAAAMRLLNSAWREGYRYMKAGVMLSDFYESGTFQPSLFEEYRSRSIDVCAGHHQQQRQRPGVFCGAKYKIRNPQVLRILNTMT